MGEPVKIVDLAQNMIRLSGKVPRLPDEEITVTARHPDPLHRLAAGGEDPRGAVERQRAALGETAHPKIQRLSRPPVDPDWLALQLAELERLADEGDTLEVVGKLGAMVREPQRVEQPQLSDTGSYRMPQLKELPVEPHPVD